MKNAVLVGLLLVLAVSVSAEEKRAAVTLEGEIVDMHCYVTKGQRGPDHAGCANACLNRDVPAGFLAKDGTLYVLLDERPISAKPKFAGLAGRPVVVTGVPVERSGVKALQLESVKAAD